MCMCIIVNVSIYLQMCMYIIVNVSIYHQMCMCIVVNHLNAVSTMGKMDQYGLSVNLLTAMGVTRINFPQTAMGTPVSSICCLKV